MISDRYKDDGLSTLSLNHIQLQTKKQLDSKIDSGEYTFEESDTCPLCEAQKEFETLSEKDRYGSKCSIVTCKKCGLIQTNPRMTQEAYTSFYNYEQKKLYVGEGQPTDRYYKVQKGKGREIYNFLESKNLLRPKMNILEVGCGAGGILDVFKSHGHEVFGIDVGKIYIDYGKSKGLHLDYGFLSDFQSDIKYDLIIYSHVLEHILDVNSELELVKKSMHENSIIYIEVPGVRNVYKNYKMDFLKYFQNAHTFHFTLTSLCNWMQKKGFKLIAGTEYVRSVFRLNNTKSSHIDNEYPRIVQHMKRVDILRKFVIFNPYFYLLKLKGKLRR